MTALAATSSRISWKFLSNLLQTLALLLVSKRLVLDAPRNVALPSRFTAWVLAGLISISPFVPSLAVQIQDFFAYVQAQVCTMLLLILFGDSCVRETFAR
jgi:hypothetical protein